MWNEEFVQIAFHVFGVGCRAKCAQDSRESAAVRPVGGRVQQLPELGIGLLGEELPEGFNPWAEGQGMGEPQFWDVLFQLLSQFELALIEDIFDLLINLVWEERGYIRPDHGRQRAVVHKGVPQPFIVGAVYVQGVISLGQGVGNEDELGTPDQPRQRLPCTLRFAGGIGN